MTTLHKTIIATATVSLLSSMATHANAGSTTKVTAVPEGERIEVSVNVADLNLASAEGQQALHYRLSRAAEKVCGSSDVRRAGGVAQAARNESCYQYSLSRALSAVTNSAVASIN